MKVKIKLLLASFLLLSAQAHAAVDVTGFSIGSGSVPYGLIAMVLILAGVGYTKLRRDT